MYNGVVMMEATGVLFFRKYSVIDSIGNLKFSIKGYIPVSYLTKKMFNQRLASLVHICLP